jgi:hypothetical protein
MRNSEKGVVNFAFILLSWTGLFFVTIISAVFMPFLLGYALIADDPEFLDELF